MWPKIRTPTTAAMQQSLSFSVAMCRAFSTLDISSDLHASPQSCTANILGMITLGSLGERVLFETLTWSGSLELPSGKYKMQERKKKKLGGKSISFQNVRISYSVVWFCVFLCDFSRFLEVSVDFERYFVILWHYFIFCVILCDWFWYIMRISCSVVWCDFGNFVCDFEWFRVIFCDFVWLIHVLNGFVWFLLIVGEFRVQQCFVILCIFGAISSNFEWYFEIEYCFMVCIFFVLYFDIMMISCSVVIGCILLQFIVISSNFEWCSWI